MVIRWIGLLTTLLIITIIDCNASVKITVQTNEDTSSEDMPIQVQAIISHDENESIDPYSFKLDDKELEVKFTGKSSQSSISITNGRRTESHTSLSTYTFTIPPNHRGIHIIPPITVTIGDNEYHSEPTTYEIYRSEISENFRLEASLGGTMPLYPGQHATLTYRIMTTMPIDLTFEQLPLLNASGFRKTGTPTIKEYTSKNFDIQEVSQEVEAIKPGTYTFNKSIIEGFTFRQDIFGRKALIRPKLRAEASPITVSVSDFPTKDRPQSFNGAVGEYKTEISLMTPKIMHVGDKIKLSLTISGNGPLSTVHLPDITKQDDFTKNFRLNDIPDSGKVSETSKQFTIEIRPLTDLVTAIPQLEFSFFNPNNHSFTTHRLNSIPVTVLPIKPPQLEILTPTTQKTEIPKEKTMEQPKQYIPALIEIAGNDIIKTNDLQINLLKTWRSLLIIPLAVILLALQIALKPYLQQQMKKGGNISSEDLFNSAGQSIDSPERFFPALEKAFILRLTEKKHLSNTVSSPMELSQENIIGEVRSFFVNIEKKRFSEKKDISLKTIYQQARTLFDRL